MNFYAYKFPGTSKPVTGMGPTLTGSLAGSGFAIAPFSGDSMATIMIRGERRFPLRDLNTLARLGADDTIYKFPSASTTRESHSKEVESIVSKIKEGKLTKAIATRCIVDDVDIDICATFLNLCESYPEAFVFCFHTPATGTWIGASPELLLTSRAGQMKSMALAGTRKAFTGGDWDHKNIEEQRIVADYICRSMCEYGFSPRMQPTMTLVAGPVEHLMTLISASTVGHSADDILRFAEAISPTPALCGHPRDDAYRAIGDAEDFQRAYYGGFCGPVEADGSMSLYVNLRSMWIEKGRYCIYAGGGITEDSVADDEWTETENKASTLLSKLRWPTDPN